MKYVLIILFFILCLLSYQLGFFNGYKSNLSYGVRTDRISNILKTCKRNLLENSDKRTATENAILFWHFSEAEVLLEAEFDNGLLIDKRQEPTGTELLTLEYFSKIEKKEAYLEWLEIKYPKWQQN